MEWLGIFISPVISILVILVGGAVMFGKFKEKSENNEKIVIRAEKDLLMRIKHLEDNNGEITIECDKRFEVYKNLMCNKIDSLEKAIVRSSEIAEKTRGDLFKQVNKNRDEFIEKYDIISTFMGETNSIMSLLKTKFLEDS